MNWHFCPHCETQLDDETFICPACRWDPLAVEPVSEPEPKTSLIERYRGTQYDSSAYEGTVALTERPSSVAGRARTVVMVGLLAIAGLYGSMMLYSDLQSRHDQPAGVLQRAQR